MRILVADDHEVVRHGLRSLLEGQAGLTVCGEAGDGQEAIELVAQLKPDLVVMDLDMPRLDGIAATRAICDTGDPPKVLILSADVSDAVMRQALAAGARGFVLKSDAGKDLFAAINSVIDGQTFLSPRATARVVNGLGKAPPAAAPGPVPTDRPLTAREIEVLRLLAQGQTMKEVAAALGISAKTVETHRGHIASKLGLHTVAELVRYALRNGLLDP